MFGSMSSSVSKHLSQHRDGYAVDIDDNEETKVSLCEENVS